MTLQDYANRLVGQRFQFCRHGYAGQLSFMFGALRLANYPVLREELYYYGAIAIISMTSPYTIKSNFQFVDSNQLVKEAKVTETDVGYNLDVTMNSASITLSPNRGSIYSQVSDWEIDFPDGVLHVGPGLQWKFEAKETE